MIPLDMLITDTVIFLFLFVTSFIWHELFHSFEVYHQNHSSAYSVYYDFKKLSMYTTYSYVKDVDLMRLAGGVYTGLLFFVITLLPISTSIYQFSFLCIGWVQLIYGYAEYYYHGNLGQRDRWVLYGVTILANLLIWGWLH